MRALTVTFAIFCIVGPALAQTPPQPVPQFAQFPSPVYHGLVGRLDLSSPDAYQYRTRLRNGAQQPVNFAGHYQLVQWGCGADCLTGAIIDVLTGQVTFLPSVEFAPSVGPNGIDSIPFNSIQFRTNSRLIVFSGQLNETGVIGVHFDLWNGSGFQDLLTIPFVAPAAVAQAPQQPSVTAVPVGRSLFNEPIAGTAPQQPSVATAPVVPSEAPSSEILNCESIADAVQRLACYDKGAASQQPAVVAAPVVPPATAEQAPQQPSLATAPIAALGPFACTNSPDQRPLWCNGSSATGSIPNSPPPEAAKASSGAALSNEDNILFRWSGTGYTTTRPFHLETPWELQWDSSDSFSIDLYKVANNESNLVANQGHAGKGSSYQPEPGDYYMKIEAFAPWNVRIVAITQSPVQPRSTPAAPPPPQQVPNSPASQSGAASLDCWSIADVKQQFACFLKAGATPQPGTAATPGVPPATAGEETSEPEVPCIPSDFTVLMPKVRIEGDYLDLTGIITNGCTQSAGPQLKWTVYNSDGTVAFSDELYPTNGVNIAPHTNYAFEYIGTAPQGSFTYEVSVISVERW